MNSSVYSEEFDLLTLKASFYNGASPSGVGVYF